MWVKIPATKMVCSCGISLGHGQKCLSSCHLLTALNFSFSRLPKYPSLPTSQLGQNPCNQNGLQLGHGQKCLSSYIYIHILLKYPCSHAIACEQGSPFLWYRSSYFQGGGTTPPSISEAQEAGSENRFHVVSVKSS